MKIYLVIGASGSGKTTYIENNIINDKQLTDNMLDEIKVCTTNDNGLLLGHYTTVEHRCKGCDTLSMSILQDLITLTKKLINENQYDYIVFDGDRINTKKFFEVLNPYKEQVEVIFLATNKETILERVPDINESFMKATRTKTSRNVVFLKNNGFEVKTIGSASIPKSLFDY